MTDLKGKVAVITGGSSGIGAATAVHFAQLGCRVVISGRNESNLAEIKLKCIAAGLSDKEVLMVVGDVTEDKCQSDLIESTISTFGQIDVLVNSAGILMNGGLLNTPIDEYDKVHNVNVRSIIRLCQLSAPHLISTKGAIVNVSSIAGICAFPTVSYYCMTKSTLDQLTKCLALELAQFGVRVNSVNPGVIVTDVHKRAGMNEAQYQQFLKDTTGAHPLGRVGDANEVAKAIVFLASSQSSFTTGDLLRIDGGRGILAAR